MEFRPCATCSKPVVETVYGWIHVTPASDLHQPIPKSLIRALLNKVADVFTTTDPIVCEHTADATILIPEPDANYWFCLDCNQRWMDLGPFEIADPWADRAYGSFLSPYTPMGEA